ncbi:MAG: hypothetical protein IH787_05540 [Nitrospirae bacterium]|nr:hypothetical protein [Nitrospirota bacterium]
MLRPIKEIFPAGDFPNLLVGLDAPDDAAVWDRPDIQKMWLEAVRWVLGLTDGDTTPLPKPTED